MNSKFLQDIYKDKIKILNNGSVLINSDNWEEISQLIKKNDFDYLMSVTSYDLQIDDMLGLAYNFYSTISRTYLEVRIEFNKETEIQSVANIWQTANWHEREAFDLMGILFKNHPDLKRILLPEDWEGHPLRKDYKEPEFYNGMPVPKDKSYWE